MAHHSSVMMNIQEHDLSLMLKPEGVYQGNDAFLIKFNDKSVHNFHVCSNRRTRLAMLKVSPYFAPPWSSFNDGSLIWTAGCRPSFFMRLIYTLCGVRVDGNLMQMLDDFRACQVVASEAQLLLINSLSERAEREEERLSAQMVFLQEKMADRLLVCPHKERLGQALENHGMAMKTLLQEAHMCRISTLKELVGVLKPAQALDFLIANSKIHKYLHDVGREKDLQQNSVFCFLASLAGSSS